MPDTDDPYRHRGTRAIQRMVEFAPSTGGLALWVRHVDLPQDAGASAIATDGNVLYYGTDFDLLPLAEQTALVAHEVLHIALRHPQMCIRDRCGCGRAGRRAVGACSSSRPCCGSAVPNPSRCLLYTSRCV